MNFDDGEILWMQTISGLSTSSPRGTLGIPRFTTRQNVFDGKNANNKRPRGSQLSGLGLPLH